MNPKVPTGLQSLLKVAALTFFGAFLGALTLSTVPTTLDGWKTVLLPALGAAIAAELVYLRQWIASQLASSVTNVVTNVQTSAATTTPAETPSAKRGFVLGELALVLGVMAALAVAGALLSGCAQLQAAYPVLDKVEQVVAADLAAGASDEKMASDVCAVLGGSQITDQVCASATQLVTDVVEMLLDSGQVTGQAKTNARAFLARRAAAAGGK